jgi:hypothetical protein
MEWRHGGISSSLSVILVINASHSRSKTAINNLRDALCRVITSQMNAEFIFRSVSYVLSEKRFCRNKESQLRIASRKILC